jgi:hypothetical protein
VQRTDLGPRWMHEHRYGVVDASLRDELPQRWTQVPIAPRFLGGDTGRCPVLVDLQALQPQELGDLTDQLDAQVFAREETLCSLLLASQLSAERVAMQLAQRISIRLVPDGAPKQFRFFDPGTFLQLPELFGSAGMAWLLQSATSVLVPWAGHWTRFDTPTGRARFRLGEEDLQSLLRIGVVNRVALQLDPPASPEAWVRRCREIDGHVRRAQLAHGLNSQADLVAFATHASVYHAAFDTHPSIQRLFKLLREASAEDELDYRELTSRLSPDDWQTIVRELSIEAETQGTAQ